MKLTYSAHKKASAETEKPRCWQNPDEKLKTSLTGKNHVTIIPKRRSNCKYEPEKIITTQNLHRV